MPHPQLWLERQTPKRYTWYERDHGGAESRQARCIGYRTSLLLRITRRRQPSDVSCALFSKHFSGIEAYNVTNQSRVSPSFGKLRWHYQRADG